MKRALFSICFLALTACEPASPYRAVEDVEVRPEVFTDHDTGCQYLILSRGSYGENSVPRGDGKGGQVCIKPANTPADGGGHDHAHHCER